MPRSALPAFVAALLATLVAPHVIQAQPVFVTSWNSIGLPLGLLLDGSGNIFSTCENGGGAALRKFDLAGDLQAVFGASAPYEGYGISRLSDGSIAVADYYGLKIQRFDEGGALLSSHSTGGLRSAYMAVDGLDNLYVADDEGDRVRKFSPAGPLLADWASPHPTGIAFANGIVYVAARTAGIVSKYSPDGAALGTFASGALAAEQLSADAAGNLYLTDELGHQLRKFAPDGTVLWTLTGSVPGYSFGSVRYVAVAIAADGTVYAGDYDHRRVLVFQEVVTAASRESWGQLKARYK